MGGSSSRKVISRVGVSPNRMHSRGLLAFRGLLAGEKDLVSRKTNNESPGPLRDSYLMERDRYLESLPVGRAGV